MAVTKTYFYTIGESFFEVDVTVDIPEQCDLTGSDVNTVDGTKIITVSLSAPVPFQFIVDIDTSRDRFDAYGHSQSVYKESLVVPANEVQIATVKDCYRYRYDPATTFVTEESWNYVFLDQTEPQNGAGPLEATVSSQANLTCFGVPTGSLIIDVTGGLPPYSFLWSDNPAINSPSRSNLTAGTYSVTVQDDASNEFILSGLSITQPTQIGLTSSKTNVSCFGGGNGTINITPSGGNSPYTYSWSDGSSARNRIGLGAGNYTVTVRDANGCSRTFSIAITQPNQLLITIQQEGKNVVNVVTGGTAPYTYLWSDGVTLKDRVNMADGTYTFSVTDANGCQQTTVIVIQDFKFYFSKNPIWLQLQASGLESKPNLSFVCEVLLEEVYESGDFINKYQSEHPAKANGSTDFNMEQVLNAYVDSNVPDFGDNTASIVSEVFKRFYLRYYEKYGNPPVPDATTQVETFYVLFGGLSEQEFAKDKFFDSYLDDQKPFLTWQPHGIPITQDQHAYLYFVANNGAHASLTLRATIRYDDTTTATVSPKTVTGAKPFEVYRFPAGVGQLDLNGFNPSKKIHSYDLQLFSGSVAASELRSYEVFSSKKHYKKLLFLNSVGGWDTVLCFGRGKKSLRTNEETISRDMPVNFQYSDRADETVSKSGTLTGNLVIANLNGYERAHLIDLAISEKVYEQTASGYLPVKVRFDFDPSDDFENLDEISLDIIYPPIRRYTPEL